jgi:hypothetical protein
MKATLFLGMYMFVLNYFLYLLSGLGEILYKGSDHNAVQHL